MIFITVGCSPNSESNSDPIKVIEKNNLNEAADNFANQQFDYFSQIELDYENFHVTKIQINHYKDGIVIDHLFTYMREVDDENLPDIQYVYLGYNLYPEQEFDETEQSITANIYMYGPTQKNKYLDEYSITVRNPDNFVTYNRATLKSINKIEYVDRYYINPILFNIDANYDADVSIEALINDGLDLIVLEIS